MEAYKSVAECLPRVRHVRQLLIANRCRPVCVDTCFIIIVLAAFDQSHELSTE